MSIVQQLKKLDECLCDMTDVMRHTWAMVPSLQDLVPYTESNLTNRFFLEGEATGDYTAYATVLDLGASSNRFASGGQNGSLSRLTTHQIRVRLFLGFGYSRRQGKEALATFATEIMQVCGIETLDGVVNSIRPNQETVSPANQQGLRVFQQIYSARLARR